MARRMPLVVAGVLGTALGIVPLAAPAASAAPGTCPPMPGGHRPSPTLIHVETVPAVPGAVLRAGSATVRTGARGTAIITGCSNVVKVMRSATVVTVDPTTRAMQRKTYTRHLADGLHVAFTFNVERLTQLHFTLAKRPSDQLPTSFQIRSSLGQVIVQQHPQPVWLLAARAIASPAGPVRSDVYWVLDNAMVHGSNAVFKAQQRFFPLQTSSVQFRLLSFDLNVRAKDRLFAYATGSAIVLRAEDGSVIRARLRHGRAVVHDVPHGTYKIWVDAPGLKINRPLSMSRSQSADLSVLSYVDVLVALVLAVLVLGGLAWVGTRALRRRGHAGVGEPDAGDRLGDPVPAAAAAPAVVAPPAAPPGEPPAVAAPSRPFTVKPNARDRSKKKSRRKVRHRGATTPPPVVPQGPPRKHAFEVTTGSDHDSGGPFGLSRRG